MSANICANRVFIYELLPPAPPPKAIINFGTVKVKPQIVNWIIFLLLSFFFSSYLLLATSRPIRFHSNFLFDLISPLLHLNLTLFFQKMSFNVVSLSLFFSVSFCQLLFWFVITSFFAFLQQQKGKTQTHTQKKTFSIQSSIFLNGLLFKFDPWPLTLSANNSMTVSIAFLVTFYHFFC